MADVILCPHCLSRVEAGKEQCPFCDKSLRNTNPPGALPYNTGTQVLPLLQTPCRQPGRTVIVIPHNSALTAMADRVIHIRNGQVAGVEVNENPTPVERIEW